MRASNALRFSLDCPGRLKARRFHLFCSLFLILAVPRALLMYLRLRVRSPSGVRWLRRIGYAPCKTMYAVEVVRFIRRTLRITGLRPAPAVLWPRTMPSSCVIAFFHSPWDLVIARELRERHVCLVRAGRHWAEHLGGQHVAWDTGGLRSLVRRVSRGAVCAVAADNFVAAAEGGFFGTRSALNSATTRLAAVTGTPLIMVWPSYEHGTLGFELGAPIAASICAEQPEEALQMVRQFFENAVRRDLTSWSRVVSFLEGELRADDRAHLP
jgi:Bacterial lipid A biosynthesis acyltransferase